MAELNTILTQLNPNPQVNTRSIKVPAGQVGQIPVVGTSFQCVSCYNVINDEVSPTSCVVKLGSVEPFVCGAGYYVNYKNYTTAFSLVQVDNSNSVNDLFFECQIGYLAETGNEGGAGAIQIAKLSNKLEEHISDFENPHQTTLQAVYDAQGVAQSGHIELNLNNKILDILSGGTNGILSYNGGEIINATRFARAPTTTSPSAVKLSTNQIITDGQVVGLNDNGQLVVNNLPLAGTDTYGIVKLSAGRMADGGHIGENILGELLVLQATNEDFGAVKLSTNQIITNGTSIGLNAQGQLVAQGGGGGGSGGQSLITDTTTTAINFAPQANTFYKYTQPITSCTITALPDSHLPVTLSFVAGAAFQINFPTGTYTFNALAPANGKKCIVNIVDGAAVVGISY